MSAYLLSAEELAEIRRALKWIRSFSLTGPGVSTKKTPESYSAYVAGPPARPPGVAEVTRVRLVSTNSGSGGWYDGFAVDGSGVDRTDVLVINDEEIHSGASFTNPTPTHYLQPTNGSDGTYLWGMYDGMSGEATPRPVVRVNGGPARRFPLAALGYYDNGPAVDAKTWQRDWDTSGTDYGWDYAYSETYLTGAYKTAGVLHVTKRTRHVDSKGRVFYVSAETDVTVG
jgi:hypothetical protein